MLEPGLSGAAARAALEIITWLSSIEAVVLSRRSMRGTSSVHLRLSSAGPSELDRRGFRVNGPVLVLVVVDAVDVDASCGGGESSVGDDDVAELGGCVLVAEAEADAEAVLSLGGVVVTASTTDDDAGDDDVTVIKTAAAATVTESADESSSAASFLVGEALMRTRAGDD